MNPSEYSDSSGGINTGTRPTAVGYISHLSVPSVSGYDCALYPSVPQGSDGKYVDDYCLYSSSGVALVVGGGYYSHTKNFGAFYLNGEIGASSSGSTSARLQYLP